MLSALVVSGCERAGPPPRNDTAIPPRLPPESAVAVPPSSSAWDSSAGPALLVATQTPEEALLILSSHTDTAAIDTTPGGAVLVLRGELLELYAGGQRVGAAVIDTVVPPGRSDSCRVWAHARLRPPPASTNPVPAWTVAFVGHRADALPVDSIEGLSPPDSAKLAAEVARIASALPGDTAVAFRGLPFVVKKAWQFQLPSGGEGLAAIVVRNVNQEANPLQEQLLIIAERDSGTASRRRVEYVERRSGPEETLEATDLLALVLLGTDRRPTLVLARDSGAGSSYALLEHTGRANPPWRLRWTSAYAGC